MYRMHFLLLSFLLPCIANGHHAFSAFFDNNTIGTIQGRLTEVSWTNPHVRFQIRTDKNEIWEAETAPVNSLQRLGLNNIVNTGDQIVLIGALSRLGRKSMLAIVMKLPNGEEVVLEPRMNSQLELSISTHSPAGNAPVPTASLSTNLDTDSGIFRTWVRTQANRNQDLPLSETALAAREAWNPVTDDPALRCVPPGMPVTMDTPFPVAFTDNGAQIILSLEQWDARRVIYMEKAAFANGQSSSLQGYSLGTWQGNTLIIETSNINWPYFDEFGTPQTEAARITERFTLSGDQQTLVWQATMIDPVTFSGPADLGSVRYRADPNAEILPYNCDY